MNTEALLKVAEILEAKAPIAVYDADDSYTGVAFDMGSWGHTEISGDRDSPHICGTSACAAGHAGFDPWFQARGFELVMHDWNDGLALIPIKSEEHLVQAAMGAALRGYSYSFTIRHIGQDFVCNGMAAIESFFELETRAAHRLFAGTDKRTTAREVASMIRAFVDAEGKVDIAA